MKVHIVADVAGPEIHSVHAKREEAEAAAQAKAGSGGSWSTATGQPVYTGSNGSKVRVVERPVQGDPLGS